MFPTEVEQLTLFPAGTLDLASLLVLPGSEEARKMTATSGRKLSDYYKKSGPVGLLARMLLDTSLWASTTYFLTWKASTTPHKRLLFRLQPSTPHTDETECSLWATPNTMDHIGQRSDEALIRQATTTRKGRTKPANLREQVDERTMRLWPTPHANCHTGAGEKGEGGMNIQTAVKLWPTPKASDGTHGGPNQRDSRGNPALPSAIHLWPTPAAQDAKNATLPPSQYDRNTVPGAVIRSGETGQLNPEWVEILQNFPKGWTDVE